MKKQLILVSVWTLLAQLAAFGKVWLTAKLFGVGPELDGYNLGFVLPSLISGTLSGFLQTGLFPVYAKLRAQGDDVRVGQFERLILVLVLSVAACVALPLILGAGVVAGMLTHDSTAAVRQWTAFVLPWAAVMILLNSIGDYLGYLMAFRGRYNVVVAAPIANAMLGIALLLAWPESGMLNLVLGTIAGLLLQVLICLVAVQGVGFRLFGSRVGVLSFATEFKQIAHLGVWILPGVVFANLTATLPTIFVAQYGEGAVAAFGYAYRFHQSLIQLLVMASSPIILAHFSILVVHEDWSGSRAFLRKALWVSVVIGMGVGLGVVLLGEPVLQLLLGYGRFDADAVSRVATQWTWLALGLAPAIYGNVLAKYLQALAQPHLMSVMAFIGLTAFVSLAMIGGGVLHERAVAIALTGSSFLVAGFAWRSAMLRIRISATA